MHRAPYRRLRKTDQFLRYIGQRPGTQALDHFLALRRVQLVAEHRIHALRGERPLDDQFVDIVDGELECRRLTAPPGADRGHGQGFAEQFLAGTGQETR